MPEQWSPVVCESTTEAVRVLGDLDDGRWLFRGLSKQFGGLLSSIDWRDDLRELPRHRKLALERRSIESFRSTARHFASPGEAGAMKDDFVALMVLRHYGVPTRLLDWTRSPWIAAYFAACSDPAADGEIWSFDHVLYAQRGKRQWRVWPETTTDGSGDHDKFNANMTAFLPENPPGWFICISYEPGFPRQNAQNAAYSATANFGCDHAEMISKILCDSSRHRRLVIRSRIKSELLQVLAKEHDVSRESLFPDTAGAAEMAKSHFGLGTFAR